MVPRSYLDKLEQDPEELYEAVEVKRDVEAQRDNTAAMILFNDG